MMGRTNCQQPVRTYPQPRNGASCPMPQTPPPGPGPARTETACSCSGFSKDQLLRLIATTGFACVDACLYLDTHPDDMEAFQLFQQYAAMEKSAKAAYEKRFGPLMKSTAATEDTYRWLQDPWPWNYQQNEVK